MMKLREMINAETIFHSFKMQYSLLYSFSIVLHFSFYRIKLFQLEKKLYFLKVFLSKKKKMAAISRSSRLHLPNLFFEPYLINIRCSLSLKYVIQLEVP